MACLSPRQGQGGSQSLWPISVRDTAREAARVCGRLLPAMPPPPSLQPVVHVVHGPVTLSLAYLGLRYKTALLIHYGKLNDLSIHYENFYDQP